MEAKTVHPNWTNELITITPHYNISQMHLVTHSQCTTKQVLPKDQGQGHKNIKSNMTVYRNEYHLP